MNTFSINALFNNAWNDYKKYWKVILLVAMTFGLVQLIGFSGSTMTPEGIFAGGFTSVAVTLASTWLGIGYLNFLLNIVDGNQARYRDIFYGVKSVEQFAYYMLVNVAYGAIVILGLVFLIIPGIIFGIAFVFAKYYIAENRLGFSEAFRSSWEITKGNRWKMFGFGIVSGLFNLAGLLALGVGLLVTVPMTQLMYARMFRELEGIPVPDGSAEDEASDDTALVESLMEETKLS